MTAPWVQLLLKIAVAAVVLGVAALGVAHLRWTSVTDGMRARLRAAARPGPAATFHEHELEGLPLPVARYFRVALKEGQPVIAHARVTWAGEFNMGQPGSDRWAPFTAVQDFSPMAPGLVWDARIRIAPGVAVRVRDGFVEGEGSMHGAVLGLVTVVDKAGSPDMAAAALQRYLGEAVWLPTSLLPSQGVTWTAIDESRARATISGGETTSSVEFRFGADGLVASVFVPDRLYDDGRNPPSAHPWQARNLRHASMHGMMVPVESTVEWLLPQGAYAYWRGRPESIEYEYVAR
ncbi:MAG: hypothetical protein IT179_12985 [Acidobacteria bacterium]|nr:hypothetical protein [Acidobacteriota bacterium]